MRSGCKQTFAALLLSPYIVVSHLAYLCKAETIPRWHDKLRSVQSIGHAHRGRAGSQAGSCNSMFYHGDVRGLESALHCSDCGYVDTQSAPKTSEGVALPARKFDCFKAWIKLISQCPATSWPPPDKIPPHLVDAYTMNGLSSVEHWFFGQRYNAQNSKVNNWDDLDLGGRLQRPTVDEAVGDITTYSPESASYVNAVLSMYNETINGNVGIVWGSELPWAEVLLARHGARLVLTVDYGHIRSTHTIIKATSPQQLASSMLARAKQFDFAFTYSSLEHSGLGRYGESLNPYGDIEAAVQTWCALRPGGLFFLGLPSVDAEASSDKVVWNAHRLYGPHRLAQMFAGYEHVGTHSQRSNPGASILHVLRKPADSHC